MTGINYSYILRKLHVLITKKTLIYVLLSAAIIPIVFPFYWMFRSAIIPYESLLKVPIEYIPNEISFKSFIYILENVPFPRWFINSLIVAGVTTLLSMIVASLAAYAFARFSFPLKGSLMMLTLAINMLPKVTFIIPYYLLLFRFSMLDTFQGLILTYTAFALPFSTWMLTGYFKSIPHELDESAIIDGCSRIGALFRVILPVAAPGLSATATFTFILGWTEYVFALVITSRVTMRTITVGLAGFMEEMGYIADYSIIMAGSFIACIPVLILFLFLQRYLIQGMAAGAVKA